MRQPEIVTIGNRHVGTGEPVFVVAEAGVNHNGDVKLARELVKQAKACGADAVKFQTFRAEALVTLDAPKADYQKVTTGAGSQLDMLRQLELGPDAHRELQALCFREGIEFLSTPYGFEDADFLQTLNVPAFKIASAQLVEDPYLTHVAQMGKPIILSTGMATMQEVLHAVEVLRKAGRGDIILLQCTTNYPSRVEDANLRAMATFREMCGTLVGYSDHTQSITAVVAATALGAVVIEKHFTIDRKLPGPDQSSSFDPKQFAEMVVLIRETERALGSREKYPTDSELGNIVAMRRSVVSRVHIPRGTILTAEMLTLKRPATGLPAAMLGCCVGRRADHDIPANTVLTEDSVEW